VTYSNSTGFRLVAVVEGERDQMPTQVDCPEHRPGWVRLAWMKRIVNSF